MTSRILARRVPALMLGGVLTASAATVAACARSSYYDPVFADRHRWDSREEASYRRWEAERQLQHVEFNARRDEEQREFWRWRHDHPDR